MVTNEKWWWLVVWWREDDFWLRFFSFSWLFGGKFFYLAARANCWHLMSLSEHGTSNKQHTITTHIIIQPRKMFIDDQQTGTLKITLMSATNLQSADSNNLSDPYCLLTVTSLHQLVNCMVIKDGDTVTNTTLPPTTTTTTTTTSPSLQQSQSSQSLNHDGSFRSRSNSNSRSNYDTIQSRVSGIVKKNLNPCWNQVFSFTVGPREQTVVEFKVFDVCNSYSIQFNSIQPYFLFYFSAQ